MAQHIREMQAFCVVCDRPTLHRDISYAVPHLAHLLLTILSFFFCVGIPWWAGIWLLHSLLNTPLVRAYRCVNCGARNRGKLVDHPVLMLLLIALAATVVVMVRFGLFKAVEFQPPEFLPVISEPVEDELIIDEPINPDDLP